MPPMPTRSSACHRDDPRAGRQRHRSADARGRAQHRRISPAREQHRRLPARHRLHAALAAFLAARARSAVAARLRGAAAPHQGACRRRRALISRTSSRRHLFEPAPHHVDPAAGPGAGRARGEGGTPRLAKVRAGMSKADLEARSRRPARSSACRSAPTRPRRSPPSQPSSSPTCRGATSRSRSR